MDSPVYVNYKKTENLKLSFEFKRIDSTRSSWLDVALFSLRDYTVAGRHPGDYSSGKLSPDNNGVFSLLPVSLIVAKNVEIRVKGDESQIEEARKRIEDGDSVGLGRFKLAGTTLNRTPARASRLNLLVGMLLIRLKFPTFRCSAGSLPSFRSVPRNKSGH